MYVDVVNFKHQHAVFHVILPLNFGSAGAMKTSDKQKAALERLKRRTVFDFQVGLLFAKVWAKDW